MNKAKATRLTLQTVALAFGLFGLFWVYAGLDAVVRAIRESALLEVLAVATVFVAFGSACMGIACQNFRRFGTKSIRNLSGLLALAAWIGVSILLRPVENTAQEGGMDFLRFVISLGPILLAFLLHRVLSDKLVAMAETASAQHDDSPANGGPCDLSQAEATDRPHLPPEAPKNP